MAAVEILFIDQSLRFLADLIHIMEQLPMVRGTNRRTQGLDSQHDLCLWQMDDVQVFWTCNLWNSQWKVLDSRRTQKQENMKDMLQHFGWNEIKYLYFKLVELLWAPARAQPSSDAESSTKSWLQAGEGIVCCSSESGLDGAGCYDSRAHGHGGKECREEENRPEVMSGGVMRAAGTCMCIRW